MGVSWWEQLDSKSYIWGKNKVVFNNFEGTE